MATVIDKKITDFISAKPWLKIVLSIATALLGAAKARNWFSERYGIQ